MLDHFSWGSRDGAGSAALLHKRLCLQTDVFGGNATQRADSSVS